MCDKPYKCSKCEYSTDSKGNANKHVRTKNGCEGASVVENIIKIKCAMCEKEFNDEILMKQHKNNCVSKRTLIVEKYRDIDSVKQWVSDINLIVRDFSKKFELLENENKRLLKLIEKLEGGVRVQNNNKKKGFEQINLEDGEDEILCYGKPITKIPTNYDHLLSIVDSKNYKKGKREIEYEVNILDKYGESQAGTASSSGFYLNGSDKKILYGNFSLLLGNECDNSAKYRHFKSQRCYCDEHFNAETGKPIE